MAATGFTPISLYYTTTASAAPTAGNLVAGELAINTNDGVLYYKDSSGVVQSIASKAGNSGSFTNLAYTGTLTGGTGIVNLGSGQFYKASGGSIGIGTASPNDKLDVNGADAFIRVDRSNGEPGITMRYNGSGTNRGDILVTSGGAMYFTAGGSTEKMRITSAGGVSIGTTTDAGAGNLFVNSKIGIGANATNGYVQTSQSGTSDSTLYRHHKHNAGGGSAITTSCTQTTTGITVAKIIAGLEEASLLLVRGSDGGGNDFMDLLITQNSGTPTVITSKTLSGSPAARTYTIVSFNLLLAMASGTYSTNCFWFQLSAR